MHSSRSCRSVIRRPLSSSWACSSIESRSPRSSPLAPALGDDLEEDRDRAGGRPPRRGGSTGVGSHRGTMIELAVLAMKLCISVSIAAPTSADVAAELGVEEGLGDDLQRQPHHVGLDVARPGRRPTTAIIRSVNSTIRSREARRSARGGTPAARACAGVRQKSPSLVSRPLPSVRFACRSAIVLDELAVLVDEHLLDQVGMIGEEDALRAEPGRDDVAVLAGPARQRAEPVGAELPQVAAAGPSAGGPGGRPEAGRLGGSSRSPVVIASLPSR